MDDLNNNELSKLRSYYKLMHDVANKIDDKERETMTGIESKLFDDELAPAIKARLQPLLDVVQSAITVTVGYDPAKDITVNIERAEPSEDEEEDDDYEPRANSIGFTVTFPNGKVIRHKDAKDVLVDTLKTIGLSKCSKFKGRKFKSYPLVGRVKRTDGVAKWQEFSDGWYIYINMSNKTKIQVLRMLSQELGLDLKIETPSQP